MIDAVIFDLGNVLVFHDNTLLFKELGQLFHGDVRARVEGTGTWERVNKGLLKGDALRQELNARLNAQVPRDDFERVWSCHFTLNVPMIRYVESLVGQVKLALLSNTCDLHIDNLRPKVPVLERFDVLTLSYEIGAMKPEPAIYTHALDALKVSPRRAVFFDDMEPYVLAAQQLGLHAHVFTTVDRARDEINALRR